jgi:hypothetical protein
MNPKSINKQTAINQTAINQTAINQTAIKQTAKTKLRLFETMENTLSNNKEGNNQDKVIRQLKFILKIFNSNSNQSGKEIENKTQNNINDSNTDNNEISNENNQIETLFKQRRILGAKNITRQGAKYTGRLFELYLDQEKKNKTLTETEKENIMNILNNSPRRYIKKITQEIKKAMSDMSDMSDMSKKQTEFKAYLINKYSKNFYKATLSNTITKKFEKIFKATTGISYAQFKIEIYGSLTNKINNNDELNNVSLSKQTGITEKYTNNEKVMNNAGLVLTQNFTSNTVTVTNTIRGNNTFSSNAQQLNKFNDKLFKNDTNESPKLGINYNNHVTEVVVAQDKYTYEVATFGSYQIKGDSTKAIQNAKALLDDIINKKEQIPQNEESINTVALAPQNEEDQVIILDFKPLKRIYKNDHDTKVFNKHKEIMSAAAENLKIRYIPIWLNSFSTSGATSPNEGYFNDIITRLRMKLDGMGEAKKPELTNLLNKLEELVTQPNNFKNRGTCRLIFALTRILVGQIPDNNIKITGGCMSAKDRMQALIYSSLVIINLYHKHNNLDFIDDKGRLLPHKLGDSDKQLLKTHINNTIGQNFLSYTGIRIFNNKNLELFINLFKKNKALYRMFKDRALRRTDA